MPPLLVNLEVAALLERLDEDALTDQLPKVITNLSSVVFSHLFSGLMIASIRLTLNKSNTKVRTTHRLTADTLSA